MGKRLFITLCLIACIQCGWAQNTVESIRKRYADIKELIREKTGEEESYTDGATFTQCYKVEAAHWLPATGGHKENITFYFDEKENENDEVYASHFLTFVTTKYNYAVREYYEEYLYDPDGKIAFIYAYLPYEYIEDTGSPNDVPVQLEYRFYFNNGKLLHALIKKRPLEDNTTTAFQVAYEGKKPNGWYDRELIRYMHNAEKYSKLFDALDQTTYEY
ncbi:MAG: hypothetical protein IKX33_02420 [Prevotella sp.]|nr:hypothetical protein [Prevotella sp.]